MNSEKAITEEEREIIEHVRDIKGFSTHLATYVVIISASGNIHAAVGRLGTCEGEGRRERRTVVLADVDVDPANAVDHYATRLHAFAGVAGGTARPVACAGVIVLNRRVAATACLAAASVGGSGVSNRGGRALLCAAAEQ